MDTMTETLEPNAIKAFSATICVFVAERDFQEIDENQPLFESICENKSYCWRSNFSPNIWMPKRSNGSNPILILCATQLAETCKAIEKSAHQSSSATRVGFEPTIDIVAEYEARGKKVRQLSSQEKETFLEWFNTVYLAGSKVQSTVGLIIS